MVVPQNRVHYYAGLMSLFYTDLFHVCLDDEVSAAQQRTGRGQRRGGEGGVLPVHFLFDEFWHLSIPEYPSIFTTTRQRRVSLAIELQSISQLKERYGSKGAETTLRVALPVGCSSPGWIFIRRHCCRARFAGDTTGYMAPLR